MTDKQKLILAVGIAFAAALGVALAMLHRIGSADAAPRGTGHAALPPAA